MMQQWIGQYLLCTKTFLKLEARESERLVSPLLFGLTFLLVFVFAMGDVERRHLANLFIAEAFLAGFFALQLALSRCFEAESGEGFGLVLRTQPLADSAWFWAKYTVVLLTGSGVLLPLLLLAALFHSSAPETLVQPGLFIIALLSLAGLAAMGVLLSSLLLDARAKQMIYPILYFPLTVPVLLAAVESSRLLILRPEIGLDELWGSWLGLLVVFDIVYLTVASFVFGELNRR